MLEEGRVPMEGYYRYFVDGWEWASTLFSSYIAMGEGRGELLLWLPLVPLLFLTMSLGRYMARPLSALALALIGECLLGAPLPGGLPAGEVGQGLLLGALRVLSCIVPACLGWWLPRLLAPIGMGYGVALALYFVSGSAKTSLVIGGALAIALLFLWRWAYPHATALLSARLLVYLVIESATPLCLPLPLSQESKSIVALLATLILGGAGVSIQMAKERRRDLI